MNTLWHTRAAAKLAEFGKIMTFKEKAQYLMKPCIFFELMMARPYSDHFPQSFCQSVPSSVSQIAWWWQAFKGLSKYL